MKIRNNIPLWLIITLAILSFLGFLDATYLTVSHFAGSELNCEIFKGCNEVTNSKYSEIFGIPIALGGTLYYLAIFITTLLYADLRKRRLLTLIPILTTAGILFTIYLIYIQFFVIGAICIYCMFSAVTTTTLFILSMLILEKRHPGTPVT
ncbi:MAG: vitamin K epoxide reductase family protein [Candidatus Peregrinibacteria bacterium]